MKVTKDKVENSQAFLTIEMEPDEVAVALTESYKRLVKKTSVQGFRKGKAPRDILERYIGKESLLENALNQMIPEVYEKAIKEQEVEAIAQPNIEITQTDPVVFKITVPVKPTVELGDYRNIQITQDPAEFKEDDVDATIEQLRHQYATWEPVERSVDFGDLVVFDIESNVGGETFVNQQGAQYQVLCDSPFPVPGFAEQLSGIKRDEEKEFNLQIPSDYSQSDFAGKEASFKVKVAEIKQECLPELNDEFARQVNPDFKTLDVLREQVSTNLKLRAEERARVDFEERIVEAVVEPSHVEFPPILVKMEIDQLLREQSRHWQGGDKGLEEYLSSINKTEEELRGELEPIATKMVTRTLVLDKITEERKIEVSEDEIKDEIEKMLQGAPQNEEEMRKLMDTPQARASVRQFLIKRKTMKYLTDIAKGSLEEPN
ncbi:trigger factor [Chloroflexota bacterium]